MFVKIQKSTNPKKKLMAIFYDNDKKKIKTTHFGAKGYNDFTIYNRTKDVKFANERKRLYLQRHKGEKGGMMTPSTLSKMILWNKPTLQASINSYMNKYNLKKYI